MKKFFRIISKIDIKEKNLVKGIKMEGLRVLGKAEDFAKFYFNNGADEIIFQDIMASLYGVNTIYETIKISSSSIFIPISVGGGIRSEKDIKKILRSGADKIILNSAAIKDPSLIKKSSELFGSSTIAISIECLEDKGTFFACTENARNKTSLNVLDWAKEAEKLGAGEIVLTLIKKDGTGQGCNFDFIEKIRNKLKIPLIVNGGVGKIEHIEKLINLGVDGAAISSMFHYYSVDKIDKRKNYSEGNLDYLNNKENSENLQKIDFLSPFELKKELDLKNYDVRI